MARRKFLLLAGYVHQVVGAQYFRSLIQSVTGLVAAVDYVDAASARVG